MMASSALLVAGSSHILGSVGSPRMPLSFRQGPAPRRAGVGRSRTAPATVSLFGGGKGGGGSKGQAYICRDCGYIEANFEAQPSDYRCPVCNAPKRRFKQFAEPVARNANSTTTRKARKAELQGGSGGGGGGGDSNGPNPAVLVGAGAAILAALYVGLNASL